MGVPLILRVAVIASVVLLAAGCRGGSKSGLSQVMSSSDAADDAERDTPTAPGSSRPSATPARSFIADGGPVTATPTVGPRAVALTPSGQPYQLPEGSLLYFSESCATCGGVDGLHRLFQDAAGTWQREALLGRDQKGIPQGWPLGSFVTDGTSSFAVLWCMTEFGACGSRYDGSVDNVPRALLRSRDGGTTWQAIAQIGPDVTLVRFEGDQVVASHRNPANPALDFRLYPSGARLSAGSRLPEPGPGNPGVEMTVVPGPGGSTSLSLGIGSAAFRYAFAGRLVPTLALSTRLFLGWAEWWPDSTVSPSSVGPDPLRLPVAIDIDAQRVSPIAGLAPLEKLAFVTPLALRPPRTWAIVRADPCLNIRSAPTLSATVLACATDGALLTRRPINAVDQVEGWAPVYTSATGSGWVRTEYLAQTRLNGGP